MTDAVGAGAGPLVAASWIARYGRTRAFRLAASLWGACGGVLLWVHPRHDDFVSQHMVAHEHYVPVGAAGSHMARAVQAMPGCPPRKEASELQAAPDPPTQVSADCAEVEATARALSGEQRRALAERAHAYALRTLAMPAVFAEMAATLRRVLRRAVAPGAEQCGGLGPCVVVERRVGRPVEARVEPALVRDAAHHAAVAHHLGAHRHADAPHRRVAQRGGARLQGPQGRGPST